MVLRFRPVLLFVLLAVPYLSAAAMERITLTTGFELNCVRREAVSESRVRLYLSETDREAYLEVDNARIQSVSVVEDTSPSITPPTPTIPAPETRTVGAMLSTAGDRHHIDVDLLASVVFAESAGKPHAVSRTGARGLMQLMPGTAAELGVHDAFEPEQNIGGGTTYLDQLLIRYHDDLPRALAAYNAGPGAVDRYHGVPPYRETRAYVARVIREFNRRKMARMQELAQEKRQDLRATR
jgi:soluble lytic murein transglycosylase-like protein